MIFEFAQETFDFDSPINFEQELPKYFVYSYADQCLHIKERDSW